MKEEDIDVIDGYEGMTVKTLLDLYAIPDHKFQVTDGESLMNLDQELSPNKIYRIVEKDKSQQKEVCL